MANSNDVEDSFVEKLSTNNILLFGEFTNIP